MIIRVVYGNTVWREEDRVDDSTVLRSFFEEKGLDYKNPTALNQLDGATLIGNDLDKTFADFDVEDPCFLLSVITTKNN